jgi:hypothetical protein
VVLPNRKATTLKSLASVRSGREYDKVKVESAKGEKGPLRGEGKGKRLNVNSPSPRESLFPDLSSGSDLFIVCSGVPKQTMHGGPSFTRGHWDGDKALAVMSTE